MGLSNIEKKSIGYIALRSWVMIWHDVFFYRSIVTLGKENIPKNKPVIFTPNHQNALMDALAMASSTTKQLVFVARSDIFKKPFIANFLYFIKILPIYRIRDGFDTVKKNQNIILKTIDVINAGNGMVILPEGNHSGIRKLRPLKKGFARMAFQTVEANNYNLDLQIVPVGIYYDNYQNYRSSLIVNYGKPISVSAYIEEYKKNSAVAINQIKDELSRKMKPLILDIESENNYDLYNELRVIYYSQMANNLNLDAKDERNRIYINQQIIKILSNFEKDNADTTSEYQKTILKFIKLRNKLGITNKIIEQKGKGLLTIIFTAIALLLTLPLFAYGFVNNFMEYWLPLRLSKMMKDPQFQSSFKFAISLFIFPIFYTVQSLLVLIITGNWSSTALYFISLPVSAAIAWIWRNYFIGNNIAFRYLILRSKKNNKFIEMMNLYEAIIGFGDKISNKK